MTSSTPGARAALGHRRLAARAALMLLVCAPMQLAIADEMDEMINNCLKAQNASDAQNAYYMEQRRATDPYLVQHSQDPVQTSGSGAGGFSCYDTTKGAIDGLLQASSGIFGINLGAIFGNAANGAAGGACGQVRQAIGQTFNQVKLQCPTVSIPGFPVNCSAGLSTNTSGMIGVNTSGALGGLSGNGSGTVGANGNVTTNGYSNGYYTPPQAPATGYQQYPAPVTTTPAPSGGMLSNFTSQVTCFLAGNCKQAQ